jgi:hypothetical protein
MLYLPAVVGFFTQMWTFNNGTINDSIVVPFFCLFMALWAMFFNALWKRKEEELAHTWGMNSRDEQELNEMQRPQFVGTPTFNPYTEDTDMVRTSGHVWGHLFKVFYLAAAGVTIVWGLGMLGYQHTIRTAFGFPEESAGALIWFNLSIGLLSTIGILVLDEIYSHVAMWFAEKENHATNKDHDKSVAIKLMAFYLLSANNTLVQTAFDGNPCR